MKEQRKERLKIVFAAEYGEEPGVEICGRIVKRLFKTEGINDLEILNKTLATLQHLNPKLTTVKEYGKKLTFETCREKVIKEGGWDLEAAGLSLVCNDLLDIKQTFMMIEEQKANAAQSWQTWIQSFLTDPYFTQAWVVDIDYDFWQNAEDPLQYKIGKRDYSHLPMKSNGKEPPRERMLIDTSNNPGRYVIEEGYREAIGATMWLGTPFWKCVGEERKAQVLAADWLTVTQLENDVLQIIAAPECFRDESNKDIQVKLRALLFGK